MNRVLRVTYFAALVLVIGGFGVIGVGAGARFSIAVAVRTLDCGLASSTGCAALAAALQHYTEVFLGGGAVVMFCGFVGLWNIRRLNQSDDAAERCGGTADG